MNARKNRWKMFTLAMVFGLALALPNTSFAQSALTDDADSLAGATPTLVLSADNKVYLKFKLSSTLPSNTPGATVSKATIKLYLGSVVSPGTVDVYQVNSNWSEQTISADSPTLGEVVQAGVTVQSDQTGKFLVLDVTPAVQQWLGTDGSGAGGAPNYGVALVAGNGASLVFDSKENSLTSHEPQLNVQLKPGGDVTSVSADGPLTVTNPTTTPNISLGIVPTANGGTGLSASGATGNILRSDGSVWTSAPLSASDIPAGNGNYIQNATSQQSDANFNIAGKGNANILEATTQFNLGGNRILSNAGTNNVFGGVGAGAVNAGSENAFFGRNAGFSNTTGGSNSFFGNTAGGRNTTGTFNSFFGSQAGSFNSTGISNSFFGVGAGTATTGGSDNSLFGVQAGQGNTSGNYNSFFGRSAGFFNTTGTGNSFFGTDAGNANRTGGGNTFFGRGAGAANTTGSNLTVIGANANVGANNLNFATAIGAGAVVSSSNTVVLGRSADTVQVPGSLNIAGTFGANILNAAAQYNIGGNRVLSSPGLGNLFAGVNSGATTTGGGNSFFGENAGRTNTTGGSNAFFGNGAGRTNTTGSSNSFFGQGAGSGNTTGKSNSFFGSLSGSSNQGDQNAFFGDATGVSNAGSFNSFFGQGAGNNNTSGSRNTFSGWFAGSNNQTGNDNTFVGSLAIFNTNDGTGIGNTLLGANTRVSSGLVNATAIGHRAQVTQSHSLVLGGISGVNGGAKTNVGIGTTAPKATLDVTGGNVLVGSPGQGLILKSPNGATCRLLSLDNAGNLTLLAIACP